MRERRAFAAFSLALAVAACVQASEPEVRDSGPKFILKSVGVDGDTLICNYARGYSVAGAETKEITLSADQYCPEAL
jgi:hypothetical protein